MQTQRQTRGCSEDEDEARDVLSPVYSRTRVSAGGCHRRGLFDRNYSGVIMQDLNSCLLPCFFFFFFLIVLPSPSPQGSQGSSASLSSTKVSSSVEDGDGGVTEGEGKSLSVSERRRRVL